MVNAHDLLWGMTPTHLPADAPAWAVDALGAGHPVVVRRAETSRANRSATSPRAASHLASAPSMRGDKSRCAVPSVSPSAAPLTHSRPRFAG